MQFLQVGRNAAVIGGPAVHCCTQIRTAAAQQRLAVREYKEAPSGFLVWEALATVVVGLLKTV